MILQSINIINCYLWPRVVTHLPQG